jgi:hypothetical protein
MTTMEAFGAEDRPYPWGRSVHNGLAEQRCSLLYEPINRVEGVAVPACVTLKAIDGVSHYRLPIGQAVKRQVACRSIDLGGPQGHPSPITGAGQSSSSVIS